MSSITVDAPATNIATMAASGQSTNGAIVWWNNCQATDPEPLRELSDRWFNQQRFNPKLRSAHECLRLSMVHGPDGGRGLSTKAYNLMSTKLSGDEIASIEVREIIKGVKGNDLPVVNRTWMIGDKQDDSTWVVTSQDAGGMEVTHAGLLRKALQLHLAMPSNQLGEWLVQAILDPKLSGSRILMSGGNYYVPEQSLHLLRELQDVVCKAAMPNVIPGAENRITVMPAIITPELVKDIVVAQRHQQEAKLEAMRDVIKSGGKTALRNRQKELEAALDGLKAYRGIIDAVDLDKLEQDSKEIQLQLGIQLARAQGAKQAASGEEDMLDAMLG